MFEALLRSRGNKRFKARSTDRDADTDRTRFAPILTSIENALASATTEWSGLSHRIDDVLARAAVTHGNDSDEYLTRGPSESKHQDLFNEDILNGQRRLERLSQYIEHLNSMRAFCISHFPELSNQSIDGQARD